MKDEASLFFPKNISNYSPPSIDKTVKRENAINTLKHYLKANSVILVEGDSSIGKTTFLAQLSEYEFKDSIVFFSSEKKAKFLNDSTICNDLFLQISVFMGEDQCEFDHEQVVSFDDLSKKFSSLKYYLRIKRKKVMFILDDLLNIEGLDDNFVASLFLIMPFDSNSKFIISVKGEFAGKYIPIENRQKFTLPVLDLTEIAKIIPDASAEQVQLIMQTFSGMPDRISTFSRLIDNGKSIDDLLNETDDSEDSLYSIEWNIAVQSEIHRQAVAFVVFSFHDLSIINLGNLLNLDEEKTKKLIDEISFLKIDHKILKLSSQRFISFARNRLSKLRLYCIDNLIEYFDLLGDEKQNLPETIRYIEAKGDNQGVVDHIDDNHILGLYQNTSSLSEINRTIKIGIKAALGLQDDNSISKLSHLNCAFTNINKSKVIVSELNCHLTEGDNVKALELIEANGSNEEKLQLYCLYCISQKKNKNEVEKEVLDKIEFLYQKFANKNLGVEKATDIAADLLPVFPDKALKIINNLDELEAAGQNKSDAAFYKMSILTLRRHGDALGDDLSQLTTLDDKRTEMFNSVEVFSPDSPSDKIINHVSKMEEIGDRIFIYRSWLKNNYKRKAAIPILTELLKLSIETTDFSIDASLYADATKCLTVANLSDQQASYEKIVPHLGALKDKGPTIEYVKLVVNLCHCEKNNSIQSKNIEELIEYLLSLLDKSVALTGLTIVSLKIIELGRSDLIPLLKQNKKKIFEILLNSEAYHIDVFKDAIANEAVYDFENSLDWCSSLNTQTRKSKAYSIAIDNFICRKGKSKHMNFEFFLMCVRKIKDENYKEDVYELVVKYYYENYASNNNFNKFFKFLDKIKSNLVKSKCLIKSISGEIKRTEHSQTQKITETLLIAINEAIQKTDSLDNQINLYFLAHKELYPIARDYAINFKHSAQKLKNEYKIATSDLNSYLFTSIDLAIRCIYQLEEYNQSTHEELEFIIGKIITLPSNIEQSYLFARIASAFQKRGASMNANLIIERNILPILNEYEDKESKEYAMCCLHSLPIVFVYDYLIFEPLLSNISELYQTIHEKIITNCSLYVLRDCLIADPYSPPPKKKYNLIKYKECNSLVKLISKAKEDNTILFESRRIIEALSAARRANDFKDIQVESIISEIKKFYDRFPIRGGIQHDGYKIILKCYVKKFNEKSETDTWDQIISAAKQVNNTSDRCFMLSEIASNLPDKLTQKRHALFAQSEALISKLSSNLEQLNRYSSLCENSLEKDKGLSKQYLKKALELCGNDSDSKQARLGFIDMINRYDDSFSSSLVNMFDADPARKKAIDKSIRNKKDQIELERKFNTNDLNYDDNDLAYSKKVSHLAWENLGVLNAKSASFKKGFEIKNLLSGKHEFSIDVYYRLFSYYIHYLAYVNAGKENRKNFIRPILSLISSNIVTVAKVYTKLESATPSNKTKNSSDFMTVKEGDKSGGELFLRKWFQKRESNQLTIIDPYIDLESIHLLSEIIEQDPDVNLTIISSMKARAKLLNNNFDRIEESIFDYWHSNIGKGELPSFKFVFIHYGTKKQFPFHDRYLYTPDSMLSVGTSLNGLGTRLSQIAVLEENEMLSVLGMVNPILTENQRFYQDERIKISGESF